jgi:hypothetical protein
VPVAIVTCLSSHYDHPKEMNADAEIARQITMDVVLNDGDFEWRKSRTEAACFADVLNSGYADFCGTTLASSVARSFSEFPRTFDTMPCYVSGTVC